ncbi:MAG: hypothetical protein E5X67_07265 [Mesorhizobium sp.]|nr:helix-turn-helix domain-containing protein [Mesorhizobium sp.]RWP37073.1 MAG: hypothetical protein EOR03_06970 [Mesorhizobium sp.]TIP29396.1 MAG: hypothetical protein E5X67_07265 [Mesorhizobium sp.]
MKLTVKNVTAALRQTRGVVKYAAVALGVHRSALWKFLQRHPELYEPD